MRFAQNEHFCLIYSKSAKINLSFEIHKTNVTTVSLSFGLNNPWVFWAIEFFWALSFFENVQKKPGISNSGLLLSLLSLPQNYFRCPLCSPSHKVCWVFPSRPFHHHRIVWEVLANHSKPVSSLPGQAHSIFSPLYKIKIQSQLQLMLTRNRHLKKLKWV